MRPLLEKTFEAVFKYMDKAITFTNKDQAEANIWRKIDVEEVGILAEVTMDGAKKSRILAAGVRKVTKQYKLFRVGLIAMPAIIETIRFYSQHGGFVLPAFGKKSLPVQTN